MINARERRRQERWGVVLARSGEGVAAQVEVCKKNKRKCTTILEEANKTCIWPGAGGRTSESEASVQEKKKKRKRPSFRDCLDGFKKRLSRVENLQVQNLHPEFQASMLVGSLLGGRGGFGGSCNIAVATLRPIALRGFLCRGRLADDERSPQAFPSQARIAQSAQARPTRLSPDASTDISLMCHHR